VIFACGRPLLSATNALSEVIAAEQTDTKSRAKALALVAAATGSERVSPPSSTAWLEDVGFRGLFLLAIVPLALLPLISRWATEPDRFEIAEVASDHVVPALGAVGRAFRKRLILLSILAFALSFITGPANSFIFLFAQNIDHLSGVTTAVMVVGAGATGLAGLLIGRWMADRFGRRITGALGMVGLALFGVLSYAGPRYDLIVGYVLGVMFGSIFAPASARSSTNSSRPRFARRRRAGSSPLASSAQSRDSSSSRHRRHRQPFRLGRGPDVSARDADHRAVLDAARNEGPRTRGPLDRLTFDRSVERRGDARPVDELFAFTVTEPPGRRATLHRPIARSADDGGLLVNAQHRDGRIVGQQEPRDHVRDASGERVEVRNDA